ncbi:MAG: DUF455 family protein [Gemmatimonadales bacterium]
MTAACDTKEVRGVTLRTDPVREDCFEVVDTEMEMKTWTDMSDVSRRERLHRHMNNELGALEIAAQCLADYPDAPWKLRMRLARQASDEARHATVLYRRLKELGGQKGEFPVANYEWGVTMMLDNLPGRLAVQNRTFEAGLIDLLGVLRTTWREVGDTKTADLLDGILADEITHVRFANQWIRKLSEEDPRVLLKVAMAIRFLAMANAKTEPRVGEIDTIGREVTKEDRLPPAVNVEGRREAEFTEDEVLEVLKLAGFRSILPTHVKITAS